MVSSVPRLEQTESVLLLKSSTDDVMSFAGAGHFGKVYTAVNNNSGELMAMKVLPLQPNDHRSIKRVASELNTFEGINHPHLVKYYGVEIHNVRFLFRKISVFL